jgi:prevent-host-death family protein
VNPNGRIVGAYEAKTHLPRLLDEVAKGETITITKHGVPVAMLVPPSGRPRMRVEEAIAGIRALRKRVKPLGDLTVRELIEEGRHF